MAARGRKRAKPAPPVRTNREEIQEKALEIFLEKGYHGASTNDVCQALGISRPTLYWYFHSKEELLFSIHKDTVERSLLPMLERVKSQEDPLERLTMFVEEYTKVICSEIGTKIQIKEAEYLEKEHQEWVKDSWREQLEVVRGSIEQLQAAGRAKQIQPTFAAFSLLGMITWAYTWFDYSRPESVDGLVQTIKDIFFSGLLTSETH